MKSYEFLCGGDGGAWETEVTVNLTEEEESILKKFSSNPLNEHLDWFPPEDKVYFKVVEELAKQCDDDLNMDSLVIWVPFELRNEDEL